MARAGLLWLLGIPIPILLLMWGLQGRSEQVTLVANGAIWSKRAVVWPRFSIDLVADFRRRPWPETRWGQTTRLVATDGGAP